MISQTSIERVTNRRRVLVS